MIFKFLRKIKTLFLRLIFDAKEFTPNYKVSIIQLIERAENRMILDTPLCEFCQTPLMFRFSHIVPQVPKRDDQVWKCPKCYHTTHFEFPLTDEAYQEEFDLRQGQFLMNPTYRLSERSDKDVMKRLQALGYLA